MSHLEVKYGKIIEKIFQQEVAMNRNLITALILASGFLLTSEQEKDQYKPQLPNFKDILEVKHSIKGRIRIQCKVLNGNKQGRASIIKHFFHRYRGIIDISVNPCIGTVIIKYNEETIQPMLIIGIILKVLGLEDEAHNENKSLITRESANIVESLSHTIYEKTSGVLDLKSSVMLLFVYMQCMILKTRPGLRPAGLTCLWWLYCLSQDNINQLRKEALIK